MKLKNRSVAVLAGGKSERFEDDSIDKASKKLGKETLLRRVIKSVRTITGEVIISVNSESRRRKYKQMLREENPPYLRIVKDKDAACKGPLRGIMTSLKHASGDLVLTVPCDVPLIKPQILNHLFQSLKDNDVAVPTWGNGNLEPLIGVFSRGRMARIAETLCILGRQRPDDLFRSATKTKFVSIEKDLKPFDPNLDSFVNINHPQDLENLPRRKHSKDQLSKTTIYESGTDPKILKSVLEQSGGETQKIAEYLYQRLSNKGGLFWKASALKRKAEILEKKSKSKEKSRGMSKAFQKAAKLFELEAGIHINQSVLLLAGHTLIDAERCWRRTNNEEKAERARKKAEQLFDEINHEKV